MHHTTPDTNWKTMAVSPFHPRHRTPVRPRGLRQQTTSLLGQNARRRWPCSSFDLAIGTDRPLECPKSCTEEYRMIWMPSRRVRRRYKVGYRWMERFYRPRQFPWTGHKGYERDHTRKEVKYKNNGQNASRWQQILNGSCWCLSATTPIYDVSGV